MASQNLSMSHAVRHAVDPRPVVLFVDDDTVFLRLSEEYLREYYRDQAVLYALDPTTTDPVAWVQARLARQERLDAVYLDERIPGKSGLHILEDLQRIEKARYVPMVIMTAFREHEHDREALEKGALRYIHKHPDRDRDRPGSFLAEALFALPQFRDQVEDMMWMDLLRNVASQLVEKSLDEVVDMATAFLAEHFGNSVLYVREHDAEGNLRLLGKNVGKNDWFQAGRNISPNTVPYLAHLLDPQGDSVIKRDCLGAEDLGYGSWRILEGWRFIGIPLTLREKRIGTITLYRQPERPPFRRKDEIFLQHFALAIASALGAERDLQQLRQRQTQLAMFIQDISDAKDEKEACDLLACFLQKEVNRTEDARANTTVRLLQPGQRTIPFISIAGKPPVPPDPVAPQLTVVTGTKCL